MQSKADRIHQHGSLDTAFEELMLDHVGRDCRAVGVRSKDEVRPSMPIENFVYLVSHMRAVRSRSTYACADAHQFEGNDADLAVVFLVRCFGLGGKSVQKVNVCEDPDANAVDEENWQSSLRGVLAVPVRYVRASTGVARQQCVPSLREHCQGF